MSAYKKKNGNKTEYAFSVIRSRILDGEYGPGYRIVASKLATELSISPIPVREAIRQLEADGLIVYKPYCGAVVQVYQEEEYFNVMAVLAILEGYATAEACQYMDSGNFAVLEEILAESRLALEDYDFDRYASLNRKFHATMISYCKNPHLQDLIKEEWNRLTHARKTVFPFVPQRIKSSNEEHKQLLKMIINQAPAKEIEYFVRQHRMNTVKAILERKAMSLKKTNKP
ncbi:GntR family transcriptional regulator [Sporomusa sp. KB1]|jgi:DNA-binding GntR family transcriptional regulator|uniref:GntR family transcriptional regulator n=1 Tax=Sporomusa sp. KB1 TaxID=943346 RepID=UPI0011A005BF|nr:GntR family transcriptional regulator [Sporomusa sp. KB1]TWH52031.1 GntR family transcriptional regulator [Sporomusa sp. KB1]